MYWHKILIFTSVISLSSVSYSDQDCRTSLESIKMDLGDVSYEESVDINNDGTKENVIFWGCGTSGCNSSLILKRGNCFSVVLERENLTFRKGMPENLPEIYQRINSDYLIAESNYSDCLGFNSTRKFFIFDKNKMEYELFYEENIRLCDHQNHLIN